MTLKQLIESELNSQTVMAQLANLQKVADAANKIPVDPNVLDSTLVQQANSFKQLVAQQIKQKQLQAQQLQAQEKIATQTANAQNSTGAQTLATS